MVRITALFRSDRVDKAPLRSLDVERLNRATLQVLLVAPAWRVLLTCEGFLPLLLVASLSRVDEDLLFLAAHLDILTIVSTRRELLQALRLSHDMLLVFTVGRHLIRSQFVDRTRSEAFRLEELSHARVAWWAISVLTNCSLRRSLYGSHLDH